MTDNEATDAQDSEAESTSAGEQTTSKPWLPTGDTWDDSEDKECSPEEMADIIGSTDEADSTDEDTASSEDSQKQQDDYAAYSRAHYNLHKAAENDPEGKAALDEYDSYYKAAYEANSEEEYNALMDKADEAYKKFQSVQDRLYAQLDDNDADKIAIEAAKERYNQIYSSDSEVQEESNSTADSMVNSVSDSRLNSVSDPGLSGSTVKDIDNSVGDVATELDTPKSSSPFKIDDQGGANYDKDTFNRGMEANSTDVVSDADCKKFIKSVCIHEPALKNGIRKIVAIIRK